jgi:membrane fusion protein
MPLETTSIDDGRLGTELLPTRLPIAATMWLSVLLVALSAVGAGVVILVPLPDTIRCPFVLVPEGGDDPVQAPREGVVIGILVAETQTVHKGEDLFVIRSQEIRTWSSELEALEQEQDAAARREALAEQDYRAALEIQATKVQQFERDLGFQEEYLATLRDFLARYERLDTKGLVPRVDMMEQRLAASKGERDVAMTRQSRDMAVLDAARLRTERSKQLGDAELERRKRTLRVATLRKLLDGAREDVVRVTAPFDGTVVTVLKKNRGDVVSAGQELCRIARSDSPLIAELKPPEAGVQRVVAGGPVRFLYDAYPYERFGTGRGTVRWVSPAAVASGDGPRFVIRAVLESQALGRNATTRPLRAGMRGEARVVTGHRTIVEYIFEPLRKLRETVGR